MRYPRVFRSEVSLRTGTWLEGSRISCRDLVLFVYCWSREMTSLKFVEHELGLSDSSTVYLNNYFREVCAWTLLQHPVRIGRPNVDVEIDESLFTRRKNHLGRALPQ